MEKENEIKGEWRVRAAGKEQAEDIQCPAQVRKPS